MDDYAFDKLMQILEEDFGSQVIQGNHIPLSLFPIWDHLKEHLYLITNFVSTLINQNVKVLPSSRDDDLSYV